MKKAAKFLKHCFSNFKQNVRVSLLLFVLVQTADFTSSCSSLWTFGDSALILWVFLALAVGVGEGVTGSRDFFSFSCSEISAL